MMKSFMEEKQGLENYSQQILSSGNSVTKSMKESMEVFVQELSASGKLDRRVNNHMEYLKRINMEENRRRFVFDAENKPKND